MLSAIYKFIPASMIPVVDAAVSQTITQPITGAVLLAGGFSGASVFCISTTTQAYLLKILPNTGADNAGMFSKYKLAANAGVAPGLYYANSIHGILITDHIKDQPANSVFTAVQIITELGHRIKTLHNVEVLNEGEQSDLQDIFDNTMAWFTIQGFFTGGVKEAVFSKYARIKQAYPWHDGNKVLTHNDLNPRNVLCDGKRLWFVDWDASSINDRYVDLAIAAIFFAPTPQLQNILLQTYFEGTPGLHQSARFFVMQPLCRFVYAQKILQMALAAQPADVPYNRDPNEIEMLKIGALLKSGSVSLNTHEGQWLYGKALLNDALRAINTNGFMEYVACLS